MAQIRFQVEQHYPAGLDQLWATLGQREYVQSKYRSLGSARLRILKLEVDETVIHVTLERRVPAAGEAIPVWARVLAVGHHRYGMTLAGAGWEQSASTLSSTFGR